VQVRRNLFESQIVVFMAMRAAHLVKELARRFLSGQRCGGMASWKKECRSQECRGPKAEAMILADVSAGNCIGC